MTSAMNLSELKNRNGRYSAQPPKPDQAAKHDAIAEQVAAFEANGGKVEALGYLIEGTRFVKDYGNRGSSNGMR